MKRESNFQKKIQNNPQYRYESSHHDSSTNKNSPSRYRRQSHPSSHSHNHSKQWGNHKRSRDAFDMTHPSNSFDSWNRHEKHYHPYKPHKRKYSGSIPFNQNDEFNKGHRFKHHSFLIHDASQKDGFSDEGDGGEMIHPHDIFGAYQATINYLSRTKLDLLATFEVKETQIQTIQDELEALKSKRGTLLKDLESSQLLISQNRLQILNEAKSKERCRQWLKTKRKIREMSIQSYFEDQEAVIVAKSPQDYPFYQKNLESHQFLKDKLKSFIRNQHHLVLERQNLYSSIYLDKMSKWKLFIRHKEEEEATQKYFASKRYQIEQQYGDRAARPRRMVDKKIDDRHQENKRIRQSRYENERFGSNRAKIPPMHMFDPNSLEKKSYMYIDHNHYEETPLNREKSYSKEHIWAKEEEMLLVKLFMTYRKDFKKIASFLPGKSMKEVISYYYRRKYALGLKLRLDDDMIEDNISSSERKNQMKESEIYVMKKPSFDGDSSWYDEDVDIIGDEEEEDIDIVGDVDIEKNKADIERINDCENPTLPIAVKIEANVDKYVIKDEALKTKSHWNEQEKKLFREYLKLHGKNWDKIAKGIKTKTTSQVKNYFQNYRVKLNLYTLLPNNERTKNKKGSKMNASYEDIRE